jgi:hypothetical protein
MTYGLDPESAWSEQAVAASAGRIVERVNHE